MRVLSALAFLPLLFATPLPAMAPADYAAAVAPEGRPAKMAELDESRKPAEVLDFMGVKPGQKALDFFAGQGYFTQILARAVGPKGNVTAFEPKNFYDDPRSAPIWRALHAANGNITVSALPADQYAAPAGVYDVALLNLVYHDMYWESTEYKFPRVDPEKVLAELYKGMKPGGTVVVVDHVGPAGDTRAVVEKLHRIDPETVKADFKRAGFTFDGESDVLRVAADDHAKSVFDPAIRGRTDRIMYRFRKPG
ncbi:class I SAM-dependent methyltransferase [Sphingomonas sp. LaA6.9]|uniref:class I SAM-dependent methyltransferase n=1 Tax=Sphingomonas sp. LaA6.9 TaxID=2919914 RepID=UPI001F502AEF|nr:methyltransferase domain-containing protein [Sphingomonas sp. LaA6.9]MCJ8156520.1 methyltransferase domain-containing protein [Sphingomonas sp. LaA6.9]